MKINNKLNLIELLNKKIQKPINKNKNYFLSLKKNFKKMKN